jgi:hypothetical protein
MTSEQKLHQWLRKQLEPCDYQRIEGAAQGFPDVNVARNRREAWIELKVYTNNRVLLRKEQYAWGMRRSSANRNVFVIAWNVELNTIETWKYPFVEVIPYSKYLEIRNSPHSAKFDKNHVSIKTILFPDLS